MLFEITGNEGKIPPASVAARIVERLAPRPTSFAVVKPEQRKATAAPCGVSGAKAQKYADGG